MVISYIISALNYAIIYSCIYMCAKFIYLKRNNRHFLLKSEIPNIIFGAYLVALLSQTILPIWNVFFLNGKMWVEISTYNARGLNLIPFKTILGYLTGENNTYGAANMSVLVVNIIGNICLFIPFGFMFPIVFKKKNHVQMTLIVGLLLSFFIEIMQFFVERSSDIDDIILNWIGVICGVLFYKKVKRYNNRLTVKKRLQ